MDYYLLLKEDSEQDASYEANLLCSVSFNKMWPGAALNALYKIVNEYPEQLEDITIITDTGKKVTIEEFLNVIDKLYIAK